MKRYQFTITWMFLFGILFTALSSLNLAPASVLKLNERVAAAFDPREEAGATGENPSKSTEPLVPVFEEAATVFQGVEPERIVIERIGVSSPIMNPEATDVHVLDAELKRGVVRYPGSAYANEEGNMFLFGHSTGLKNVRNKAFEAFNKLGTLMVGDIVKVYAKDRIYEYSVVSVALARAAEARVEFSTGRKMLTLVTCNTFGKKEDRFVVTAEFKREVTLLTNT